MKYFILTFLFFLATVLSGQEQWEPTNGPYGGEITSLVMNSKGHLLGKEIKTLVDEEKSSGNYEVNFNAANLASGIYYYKLTAGDFVEVQKMLLLR